MILLEKAEHWMYILTHCVREMGNEYAHWIQSVRQVGYRFVAEDHNA